MKSFVLRLAINGPDKVAVFVILRSDGHDVLVPKLPHDVGISVSAAEGSQ